MAISWADRAFCITSPKPLVGYLSMQRKHPVDVSVLFDSLIPCFVKSS